MRFMRAAGCGLILLAGAASTPSRAQSLDTVSVGYVNSVADTPFLIAEGKGFFRDAGIEVKFQTFDSGAAMIASAGTGQLDAGGGAPAAGLYNAVALKVGIKIVADRATDAPGYGFNVLLVRKALINSGRFKQLADLKGMKFAEPAKGSTSLPTTVRLLQKAGLKYEDVEHVYLGFPEQVAALTNGSIDATGILEPWATLAVKNGVAVRVAGDDTWYPNQQLAVVFYGSTFIEKRPDVAKRFMFAYVKALRYYADALKDGHIAGPNAADVLAILTARLKIDDPSVLREMTASSVDPTGHVNVKSLAADYATFKQYGLIQGDVAIEQVVDMSFADAADAALGPYRPKKK